MAKQRHTPDRYGSWIWKDDDARASRMIVFLHGYTGHPESTWRLFPELLRTGGLGLDVDFEIASFGYETNAIFNFRSIETISELFLTYLDTHANSASDVFVVAHSLGGVIARAFLLRSYRDERRRRYFSKVRQVHMIGAPQKAVRFPFTSLLILNRIVGQLAGESPYIRDLMAAYLKEIYRDGCVAGVSLPKIFNYVGDNDWVTPYDPSRNEMEAFERFRVIPADHVSSAKPHSAEDAVYQLVTREIRAACSPTTVRSYETLPVLAAQPWQTRTPRTTPERWLRTDKERARELLRLSDAELSILLGMVTLEAHQKPIGSGAILLWAGLTEELGLLAICTLQDAKLIVQAEVGLSLSHELFSELSGLLYSSSDTPGLPPHHRIRHLRERLRTIQE